MSRRSGRTEGTEEGRKLCLGEKGEGERERERGGGGWILAPLAKQDAGEGVGRSSRRRVEEGKGQRRGEGGVWDFGKMDERVSFAGVALL